MSDHLPECPTTTDPHGLDDGYACPCECQCEILRTCEQRVLEEAVKNRYMELNEARRQAYSVGLHRAREAVARTCGHTKHQGGRSCAHDDALAAIDALRGQPADQTGYNLPDAP